MSMYTTKSILPKTAGFAAKMLQHEVRANFSPENTPNFTNPLVSNIEQGNKNFTFKESTSKSNMMYIV